jgi:hypothetical protein
MIMSRRRTPLKLLLWTTSTRPCSGVRDARFAMAKERLRSAGPDDRDSSNSIARGQTRHTLA